MRSIILLTILLTTTRLSAQTPQLLKDINPGVGDALFLLPSSNIGEILPVILNNRMYFPAANALGNTELWYTDGTLAGTGKVTELHPDGASNPNNLFVFQDRIYFSADNGMGLGDELCVSDGTSSGTFLLKDLNPGPNSSNVKNFYVCNGRLYFECFYYTEDPATRLYQSDGTPVGTDPVYFPETGYGIYHTGADFQVPPVIVNEYALIGSAYNGAIGLTNLATNHTSILSSYEHSSQRGFTELYPDSLFVFSTDTMGISTLLWRSDGTPSGTFPINHSGCIINNSLTKYNDALYYWTYGCSPPDNEGLWKTDGTSEGTVLIKPAASINIHYDPTPIVIFNGLMYFISRNDAGQTSLWRSDGTEIGTTPFFTFDNEANNTLGASLKDAVIFNNRLFFTAFSHQTGREVWSTDGTAAGTEIVYDLNPGAGSSIGQFYTAVFFAYNGRLFFQADNSSSGREWFYIEGLPSHVDNRYSSAPSVLYPNPSGNFIRISNTGTQTARLSILSSTGETVYIDSEYRDGKTVEIHRLPCGTYLLKLESDRDVQFIGKFIRE